MAEKVYVNGMSIKAIETKIGKIFKVGIKTEMLVDFLAKNSNEKGYCNIDILERKEPGKYGDTHYAVLNEYKPEEKAKSASDIPGEPKGVKEENDDIPF